MSSWFWVVFIVGEKAVDKIRGAPLSMEDFFQQGCFIPPTIPRKNGDVCKMRVMVPSEKLVVATVCCHGRNGLETWLNWYEGKEGIHSAASSWCKVEVLFSHDLQSKDTCKDIFRPCKNSSICSISELLKCTLFERIWDTPRPSVPKKSIKWVFLTCYLLL